MLTAFVLMFGIFLGFGLAAIVYEWARGPRAEVPAVATPEPPQPAPTMLARMLEPGRQLASQAVVAGARLGAGDLRRRLSPLQIEKTLEDGHDEIERVGRLIAEQTVQAYCEGMRDLGSALRRHSGLPDTEVDAAMAVALERNWAERDGKRTTAVPMGGA